MESLSTPEEARMKIGVLGTGIVGTTLGDKLVALGHDVKMGAREAQNEKASAWVASAGARASSGTFRDAAQFGELLFNCTSGHGSLPALESAGEENLAGKVLVDVANPLDFSRGMPPSLFVFGHDSLGEQLQRAFPRLKVVKSLNTITAGVMVEPGKVGGGEHTLFVCGNDAGAKELVMGLLRTFGWRQILDLGDITAARGTEAYLLLWLRLWQAQGTHTFNVKVTK
jgi:predicted dinucleotide-binding enzyme